MVHCCKLKRKSSTTFCVASFHKSGEVNSIRAEVTGAGGVNLIVDIEDEGDVRLSCSAS